MIENSFEMETKNINFKYVYKIFNINIKKITFRKYSIKRVMTDKKKIDNVIIDKIIGDETYEVTPEVNMELVGCVGDIIKGFIGELQGKKKKKLIIDKIIHLDMLL